MAECLVALDCIADGIDHLNPDLITDIGTVFPTELKSEQGLYQGCKKPFFLNPSHLGFWGVIGFLGFGFLVGFYVRKQLLLQRVLAIAILSVHLTVT